MTNLTQFVIPKIMNSWEYVAYGFYYELETIEAIKDKGRENPKRCCEEFFKDWLMTENGAKAGSKTWSTLLNVLKPINEIGGDIKKEITEKVLQLNY